MSHHFDIPNNSSSIELVLPNQELDALENPDPRFILVKTGDSPTSVSTSTGRGQSSNFPTPPSGNWPSRPATVNNPYISRITLKLVLCAGGASGVGGAMEFDENNP